eukprot:jgi/Undpi1/5444/HiC_scaffold_2.g00723.m1
MRERSKRLKKSCWSWVALGALQSCLAVAATAAPGHKPLPPCSTKGDAGLASPPNRNPDHAAQELRRTIEEGVLNGLSRSIMEHGERVESGERRARPFVTLTYAQSIDGSISAADKSQVFLSGPESRTMTHGLRSIHDAILVGAGTVRQDNPRLNIRHWPPGNPSSSSVTCPDSIAKADANAGASSDKDEDCPRDKWIESPQHEKIPPVAAPPRPVILAGSLSQLPRCMRLGGAVIFTDLSCPDAWRWLADWASRSREGSSDHAANDFVVVHSQLRADGRCDVGDCLEKLYSMGIRSLMVEGGATVISSFLRGYGGQESRADSVEQTVAGQLVDRVVVTIAPVFLQGYNVLARKADGRDASSLGGSGFPLPLLDVGYVRLGQDLVVVGAPARGEEAL